MPNKLRKYHNNYVTTLTSAITDSATTIPVSTASGTDLPASSDNLQFIRCTIYDTLGNYEIVDVYSVLGSNFNDVIRGVEGTTPRAWNSGDFIGIRPTKTSLLSATNLKNIIAETGFDSGSYNPAQDQRLIAKNETLGSTFSMSPSAIASAFHNVLPAVNASDSAWVNDDDDTLSSDLLQIPTNRRVKAYVDAQIGGGVSVSNGNKGDIIVSGSGESWIIDNDVVTYSKMQNVTASQRFLGRNTSGAGDVEELSVSTVKAMLSLNNVENTALSTWAGSGNIATLGTVTSGTIDTTLTPSRVLAGLDSATISTSTVAPDDKVLIRDTSASDATKTATTQEIRDLMPSAGASKGAIVKNSTNQSIADNTLTLLNFNSETYDTSSLHDTVTNNSRLTVPAGITKIIISTYIRFAANATGRRVFNFRKNGVGIIGDGIPEFNFNASSAGVTTLFAITPPIVVTEGDYFEVLVLQNSGGVLDVTSSGTYFSMELIE